MQEKGTGGVWGYRHLSHRSDSEAVPQIMLLLDSERGESGSCWDFYIKKFFGTMMSDAPKTGLCSQVF